ncbi:MAG: hypothetical protein HRU34_16205 [Richelia sp.]|nr:hypothetical protein [Richelia sp.]CDN15728.1 hypothetical protein RintRC_7718 [Richelia intracellularis]
MPLFFYSSTLDLTFIGKLFLINHLNLYSNFCRRDSANLLKIEDYIAQSGVAESGDDFTKFSTISQTISQWFQTLIHPALMQRPQSSNINALFTLNKHTPSSKKTNL